MLEWERVRLMIANYVVIDEWKTDHYLVLSAERVQPFGSLN